MDWWKVYFCYNIGEIENEGIGILKNSKMSISLTFVVRTRIIF